MGKIFRRSRFLISRPREGFIIKMEEGKYFTNTRVNKDYRTNYFAEEPYRAKVYRTKGQAEGSIKRISKNMAAEFRSKYESWQVVAVDSFLVDAYEIDIHTYEVAACREWPDLLEGGDVFSTEEAAISHEVGRLEKRIEKAKERLKEEQKDLKKLKERLGGK